MKKVYYRVRQAIFALTTRLFQHICPKIISGEDSILTIYEILKKKEVKKVFVVTTNGFIKRKTLEPFFKTLDDNNISYALFTNVTPDPTIVCIEEGLKVYKENNCDSIVSIGGGSVIDCSKAIGARVVSPKKSIPKMKGILKVGKKLPLFIAVPTTAGTGSEVTCASVVTDTKNGTHYKYPIEDYALIPRYAILDANLTLTLNKEMTATTGMDALTHAIEAYTNRFASKYVKRNALNAIKMIFENLEEASNNGSNITARTNMLLASTYAGIAFTNNFVGYVHALAHAIGGIYGVSHGTANSILLTPVIRRFGSSCYKELSEIADFCNIKGGSVSEKANNVLDKIDEMKKNLDIPFTFSVLEEKDYDEIIDRAISEGNPTYPVPTIWGRDEFKEVLDLVKA